VPRKNGFGLQSSVRIPKSIPELHTMLRQTTWIPATTGNDLFYHGHSDGAFVISQHPQCSKRVHLPWNSWDLYMNTLNVNLGLDKVQKFWYQGLAQGI
jgi:hypothetical protein